MIGRGLLLAAFGSAASTTWAQAPTAIDAEASACRDDAGVDRCAPAQQAKVRALFGADTIEALQARQVIVYRAFFVDGYGRDMPMVSFERRPGRAPEVIVRPPARADEAGSGPIRADVSAKVWDSVVGEARLFDRDLTPLPPSPWPTFCLHSWVATVEAAEAARPGPAVAPRRKTQSACGSGLAITYAFKLARLAREAIPACAALDMDPQRNDLTALEDCTRLHGDRLAAAEVQNAFGKAVFSPQAGSERAPPFSINSPARLSWAGERVEGWRAARDLWRARAGEGRGVSLLARRYEGEAARRVKVSGEAGKFVEDRRHTAAFDQIWIWDPSLRNWMIESWTVEAFKPQGRAAGSAG